MLSGISIVCFASCYAIALALEVVRFRVRHFVWHRAALIGAMGLGLLAHTLFLFARANAMNAAPLSSPADWLLVAAWVLAVVYLGGILYLPRAATGLILLPITLGLIAASLVASHQPFAPERASRFWGNFHGSVLLLGAVTVCVGFAAGLMYLVQASWLKHRRPPSAAMRLPSLEWLERINSNSLAVSALLIGLGFGSGVILNMLTHRDEARYYLWRDPVVLSLGGMLVYLVGAEAFRLLYPAARRGRKVAYLTLASFGFLVLTLAALLFIDTVHGRRKPPDANNQNRAGDTPRIDSIVDRGPSCSATTHAAHRVDYSSQCHDEIAFQAASRTREWRNKWSTRFSAIERTTRSCVVSVHAPIT